MSEQDMHLFWKLETEFKIGVGRFMIPSTTILLGSHRPLRMLRFFVFGLLLTGVSFALAAQPAAPETVTIPCGNLRLKALLWRPVGSGPFPAVLFNHGSGTDTEHTAGMTMAEAARKIAPVFVKHGYAFLYLFRRGQGLSADQGPYMGDVLRREEAAKGAEASQHLQFVLLNTEYLDDVISGLSFLKHVSGIDSRRVAIVGHSFGGQLALLAAERDATVRATVAFDGAAHHSWERSAEVRERLFTAVRNAAAPIMLIQASNDYSTAPSRALADELERLHKRHVLRIYPPVGQTADDGHNAVYLAIPAWEEDVFQFLDTYVKPRP
jgi:carboxymethylenebutenolidase